jgi:hypothetical protein
MRWFGWMVLLVACGGDDSRTISDAGDASAPIDATPVDATPKDVTVANDGSTDATSTDASVTVVPPLGGSSTGSGGATNLSGTSETVGNVDYQIIVPATLSSPAPFLLVYSGTEGGATMTDNLISVAQTTGTDGFIRAVLDGVFYNGDGAAGASVLDDVRSKYDVDNDRTYLLSESAGTTAGLQLGFHLRESYFAAYWVNDINANGGPAQTAAQVGFQPWGQVGPGGDTTDANLVVTAMTNAGYRLPNPAPYAGQGAGTHGDPNQFIAAVSFFPGKTR